MDAGIDEALALFIVDCATQLDTLETQLMALERNPADHAVLDAVFRAAHTIKGNAMVVHQGEVEWFAHIAESVLVRLRDGSLWGDAELISVLLACCDHLRFLVGMCALEEPVSPEFADADRARLIGLLVPYLEGEEASSAPVALQPARGLAHSADACWRLSVCFAPEVLRQGMDPAYFLQHLASLGRIFSLQTFTDALPEPPDYDPELCYLHFEVFLDSQAERQSIEDVFSFVRGSCELQITPPAAQVRGYVERIQALPGEDLHTGEMLLRVGALTPDELASGLRVQRGADGSDHGQGKLLGSILVDEGFVKPELVSAVLARQDQIKQEQQHSQLRVSTEQLETLVTRIGALQCVVDGLARRGDSVSPVELSTLQLGLGDARRLLEELRRTHFGEQFRRLHRVVRDTAQALGKRVDLKLTGSEIVLERAMADLLGDALMHLLRNAIDHGLETPVQRLQAGKPAHGGLSVEACVDGDWLLFAVSDDGAGIDADKVCTVAHARGLLPLGPRPDVEALYALLFEPGFSTVEVSTHFSGRGVGLDVVRDAVLALGGEICVHSAPGLGSRFEIRVPALNAGEEEMFTAANVSLSSID